MWTDFVYFGQVTEFIGANFYAILGLMVAYTLFELNSMYEFMRNTKSNTAEIIKPNLLVNKTIKNNLLRFMFGSGMLAFFSNVHWVLSYQNDAIAFGLVSC